MRERDDAMAGEQAPLQTWTVSLQSGRAGPDWRGSGVGLPPMVLDGANGGGQVLRTALSVSALTGRALEMANIRGARRRPGLMRQHLAAVHAAAAICDASLEGAELNSTVLRFVPGALRGGAFVVDIGSAGSTSLVAQTLAPALLLAPTGAEVVIHGGTHNSAAPPAQFLTLCWLPALRKLGADVDVALERWGFMPAGGGRLVLRVRPAALRRHDFVERAPVQSLHLVAASAQVGGKASQRELVTIAAAVRALLPQLAAAGRATPAADAITREAIAVRDSLGPGNIAWATVRHGDDVRMFSAVGERGRSAEDVGRDVAAQLARWLRADGAVDIRLADQLLLPLALAGGGSLRVAGWSEHLSRQLETLAVVLPEVTVRVEGGVGSLAP